MLSIDASHQRIATRRVFQAWSIDVPTAFAETFVDEQQYWHAYHECCSVSLTSLVLRNKRKAVPADEIVRSASALIVGTTVHELPPRLVGRAVIVDVSAPARASRALSGIVAIDGRLLIVTITSDDLVWAQRIWGSIRAHQLGRA